MGKFLGRFTHASYAHAEEEVAQLRGRHPGQRVLNIGLGDCLLRTAETMGLTIDWSEVYPDILDGMSLVKLTHPDSQATLYFYAYKDDTKERMDCGLRQDFIEIGWRAAVDAVDEHCKK